MHRNIFVIIGMCSIFHLIDSDIPGEGIAMSIAATLVYLER